MSARVAAAGAAGAQKPEGAIFVYGTLMAPEVVQPLIGRMPPNRSATLRGHRRLGVTGQAFPAVVRCPSSEGQPADDVKGMVFQDLSSEELMIFDEYEDDHYLRETVAVLLEDGTEVAAYAYIWKDSMRHLLSSTAWDYEAFRTDDLEDYVRMVESYAQEIRDSIY